MTSARLRFAGSTSLSALSLMRLLLKRQSPGHGMLYADGAELIKEEGTEHFTEALCKAPQGRSHLFLA